MSARVRVDGAHAVVRALHGLASDLRALSAFAALARLLARESARYAPKRTGRLARSIRPVHRPNYAAATTWLPYAWFQNYGVRSRNIEPQHFMQRADRAVRSRAPAMIERSIALAIARRGLR